VRQIDLQGAYDLQVAYTLLKQPLDDPFLKGMLHALRQPGIVEADQLSEVIHRKVYAAPFGAPYSGLAAA
jgi:hypothetical protein